MGLPHRSRCSSASVVWLSLTCLHATVEALALEVDASPLRSVVAPGKAFDQAVLLKLRVSDGGDQAVVADSQELCIALDVSESMVGRKLENALYGVSSVVRDLRPHDRLHLLTFQDGARIEFRDGEASQKSRLLDAVRASPKRAAAARQVAAVRQNGQNAERSDLVQVLGLTEQVISTSSNNSDAPPRRLFLFTDGLTSEGPSDYWDVLASVEALQQRGVVVSVFAVGGDREQRLLAAAAKAGRGTFQVFDGGSASLQALRTEASSPYAPAALDATLWLTPESGATGLRASGHRRRRSAANKHEMTAVESSERIRIGTLPWNFTEEVFVELRVPALHARTPYLLFDFSAEVAGVRQFHTGRAHVNVLAPSTPVRCEEHSDAVPLARYSIISGAEWEAAEAWNCMGDAGSLISSFAQPPRGENGSAAGRRWCASRCLADPDCVAFSYPNPGDGQCHLRRGGDAFRHSGVRLRLSCGQADPAWDYYTMLDRQPRCREPGCAPVQVSGAQMVEGPGCRKAVAADGGSTGNGVYTCTPAAAVGGRRNLYSLREGAVLWELLWVDGHDFGATALGLHEGWGGRPKWVLRGNGNYRYYAAVEDNGFPEVPETGWRARTSVNSDVDCAAGTLVVQPFAATDVFVLAQGRCLDAMGTPSTPSWRRRLSSQPRPQQGAACEANCLAEAHCVAYEMDTSGACELLIGAGIGAITAEGGGASGERGAQCYLRVPSTHFSQAAQGQRCANAHHRLSLPEPSLRACAEAVAEEPSCGFAFHFSRVVGGGTCECAPAGAPCDVQSDTNFNQYDILVAFGTDQGVALRRDLQRLLEREEEADPARQSRVRKGYRTFQAQRGVSSDLDRLAARAKALRRHSGDATVSSPAAVAEAVLELASERQWQTAACVGAPALCRAPTPTGVVSTQW